jgi:hypothetical protein
MLERILDHCGICMRRLLRELSSRAITRKERTRNQNGKLGSRIITNSQEILAVSRYSHPFRDDQRGCGRERERPLVWNEAKTLNPELRYGFPFFEASSNDTIKHPSNIHQLHLLNARLTLPVRREKLIGVVHIFPATRASMSLS